MITENTNLKKIIFGINKTASEELLRLKPFPHIIYDFNIYFVYQQKLNIRQCLKCCSFKHDFNLCKEKPICVRCSGDHYDINCNKEKRCYNCLTRKPGRNPQFYKHMASSNGCTFRMDVLSGKIDGYNL